MNWTESLGLTLLHFVWQGLVIGLVAALINRALKKASANARYLASCCAMALMGITAVGTFLWINQPSTLSVAEAAPAASYPILTALTSVASAAPQPWTRLLAWLDFLWFAGVCALAMRSAMGWFAAMRLRHTGVTVAPAEWQARAARLIERLAISAPVRVCESMLAEVPSVIGWLRPVILIPAGTLAGLSTEQLETILAHELAHIRRHDYLINLLQTAIETLLFYHPAVWWTGNRIRTERENCCDDLAVEVCGDAFLYARALASLEQLRHASRSLALAATDGGLLRRIGRLLGQRAEQPGGVARSYWLPALLMIMLAAAGVVAQQRATPAPNPPASATVPAAENAPEPPPPEAQVTASAPAASKEDFIDSMERAGLKGLTVDQLVSLKIHGVTPEYIQQTKAMGMSLNVDQLTAFRIHGVTPEYIQQTKAMGLSLDADQLTAFRIHGVTPEYMNGWKTRGWNLTPDQLTAFRIHGVNAQAIDQMRALGFTLSADDAVAMRIHDITPEFARTWRDAGYTDVKFDQLVALRIHGVNQTLIQARSALPNRRSTS